MDKKIEKEKQKRLAFILTVQGFHAPKKACAVVNAPQQALPPRWGAPVYVYPVYYDPRSLQAKKTPQTTAWKQEEKGGKQ